MSNIATDFWPGSLAHLGEPLLAPTDDYVTIACVSSEPVRGYEGARQLYTALIPYANLQGVLSHEGGIGWRVECGGPYPSVPKEGGYKGDFWIEGVRDERYEAVAQAWTHHNEVVLVPDNDLLACYGLIPRSLKDGTLVWDDPCKPVYDVVRVRPLSHYQFPKGYTPAGVEIRREYLEDYLSLKGCAAVAVFYEERYSSNEPIFDAALGSEKFVEARLSGRLLELKRVDPTGPEGHTQLSRVWGCRLLMEPHGRPVSEESEAVLEWPDLGPVDPAHPPRMEEVYVSDCVLKDYESREQFERQSRVWSRRIRLVVERLLLPACWPRSCCSRST